MNTSASPTMLCRFFVLVDKCFFSLMNTSASSFSIADFFFAHEYLGVAYDAVQAVDENGKPKDAGAGLEGMGLVCVWKVPDEPAEPKFLLAAHVSPTSHVLVPLATEMLCVGKNGFFKSLQLVPLLNTCTRALTFEK